MSDAKTDMKPCARPFLAAAKDFASGKDTPRDFLERCLAETDAREKDILAYVATNIAGARAAADASSQRWRDGKPLSPIDGMPVGVKDVIETADMPTGMGSPLYDGWSPGHDAASVHALREAGAVIVGKTVTTEFAASEPGPTRNPWDITRTPGGSSSGSAAGVAAGYFSAALGTQVIGSILRPSSYCGVIGYKPTFGTINRGGSHDYMSQSSQGVIAASLEDCWQTAWEISQRCGGDPGYGGLAGPGSLPQAPAPKILVLLETAGWAEASDEAKTRMLEAAESLRAAGISVLTRKDSADIEAAEQALVECMGISRTVNAWESRWPLNTYRDRDAAKLSKAMYDRSLEAEAMTLDDYRNAIARRAEIRAVYARLGGIADGCITLPASAAAPVGLRSTGSALFAVTSSMLGAPSLSLPVLQEEGLPLGMQVIGFDNRDAHAFAVSHRILNTLDPARAVRA
jgi:Asp-tRNA(Asn)/Glu-tRNA(Gln) amidotransferase A subunit family amidase